MKDTNKIKNKKVFYIILGSILGFILLVVGTCYIVMRSYIGKINYVPLDKEEINELDEDYTEWDVEEDLVGEVGQGPENGEEYDDIIAQNTEFSNAELMSDEDVLNVLLIGTDNRKSGSRGLSDSMIIVSINSKTKQIVATSLLRDIYLSIPGKTNNNRLNAAYIMGGTKLLIETIESNFKIDIDKYAAVDFYSFIDIVDQVGGVTLEITKDELRHFNNYVISLNTLLKVDESTDQLSAPGTYLLNGKQALAYARIRYVGTDFARTARQRLVLELIFNKMKDLNLKDMASVMSLIFPNVTTDFSYNEMLGMIIKVPTYLKYEIVSWSVPMKGTYKDITVRKMAVLGIDFDKNIEAMNQKIYLGQ